MLTYVFFYISMFILSVINLNSKNKLFLYFLSAVIIIIFSAFRYEIGADTPTYMIVYNDLNHGDTTLSDYMEPGYVFLNHFFSKLGCSYVYLQATCFIITFTFLCLFITKTIPPNLRIISLVVFCSSGFYIVYCLSGIRQGVAIAVALYSFKYILRRQFSKFILILIFGSLFHISILFFIPAYWFPTKKFRFYVILIAFVVAYFFAPFVNFLFKLILSGITGHYGSYASTYGDLANQNSGLGIIVRLIIWSFIAFTACESLPAEDKKSILIFNLYIFGVMLYLFNRQTDILNRFNEYYLSFIIPLIPLSIKRFDLYSKVIYWSFISFLLSVLYITTILFEAKSFIPYRSYLSL